MFRQSARLLASKRFFSVTPQRSNLISDLYVTQIKAFKPTPVSEKEAASAVKAFQLPSKPSVPEAEISADALNQYESSEVETASAGSTGSIAAEEDWFVFEDAEEAAH
ncbi:ATP synthase subunit H, mitochondrial [[Candida] anglica]|uniref:ATP synthase subunit H, mitochondrial n=1 Tax=[Candida] anglica TaxID=148631 RepID=A0ABP0ECB3_9ASCO